MYPTRCGSPLSKYETKPGELLGLATQRLLVISQISKWPLLSDFKKIDTHNNAGVYVFTYMVRIQNKRNDHCAVLFHHLAPGRKTSVVPREAWMKNAHPTNPKPRSFKKQNSVGVTYWYTKPVVRGFSSSCRRCVRGSICKTTNFSACARSPRDGCSLTRASSTQIVARVDRSATRRRAGSFPYSHLGALERKVWSFVRERARGYATRNRQTIFGSHIHTHLFRPRQSSKLRHAFSSSRPFTAPEDPGGLFKHLSP